MYWFHYDHSADRLAMAKRAVDRAFEIDSALPEAHHALGVYYWIGYLDYDRSLRELAIAEASKPNDAGVALTRAAVLSRQGSLREAVAAHEKALELDPGSALAANTLAQQYDRLRDFGRAEAAYDRAIALSPDWAFPYFWKAGMYLRWQGSTEKARAVLDVAAAGVAEQPFVLYQRVLDDVFDRRYDEALGRLSSTAPDVIADQFRFIPRAQLYAQVYSLMQRHDLERAYYDSARTFVVRKMREQPDDPRVHSALGIAYAGLGRQQEALAEGRKAVELMPVGKDAYRGYYRAWDLARIYTMVGEYDAAVTQLQQLLSIPGNVTVAWLRIDPTWDPLRSHPRFQTLVPQK
jgi:tetratricopeptide (TPR) repeat protein